MSQVTQVIDDPKLLQLMLDDRQSVPEIYQPTNYWSVYEQALLPEISRFGLHDFRRRRHSILTRLGAADPLHAWGIDVSKSRLLNNRLTRRIPGWVACLSSWNALLNKCLPVRTPYDLTIDQIRQLCYEFVRSQGCQAGAQPLEALETSLVGNPEESFHIDGRAYTMSHLDYYLRYVYCHRFINFDSLGIMVELGSGSGKQIEVIKKLHPKISFLAFDLPPQLYVCEQYLTSTFPQSVVSYRVTRHWDRLPAMEPGRIYLLGNWKFPLLDAITIDLFWNAASFQEMEPQVVVNYLTYVNRHANAVFLHEVMGGKEVAKRPGAPGVLRQTTLEDYRKGLPNFHLIDLSPSLKPTGALSPGHSDSFWTHRPNSDAGFSR